MTEPENINRNNPSVIPEIAGQNPTVVLVLKLIVVTLFLLPLLHHSVFRKTTDESDSGNVSMETLPVLDITKPAKKKIIILQPSCPPEDPLDVLLELCHELYEKSWLCSPEDFHNLEKHKVPKSPLRNSTASSGEPRGTIVGCVAAGLLLTSLGAAFVELYKAKSQTQTTKTKPPMSRKCSLADLTVLKHNRRELVRRESILELPETGGHSKEMGRKVSRPPLRLD